MEKRHNTTPELATWPTRKSMVLHGLEMNLSWLALVNVSFALMLLLRNILFNDI
ncbi:GGDEF domain-containing protein, partial [Escherichia coli]